MKTMAAKTSPASRKFEDVWDDRAPLGWDVTDRVRREGVSPCCRDWFPATTGG